MNLQFTINYDLEVNCTINVMMNSVGKFHHKSEKEIDKQYELISKIKHIDYNKYYSTEYIMYKLKIDKRVAKYNNNLWFFNEKTKTWGYSKFDQIHWLENCLLSDIEDQKEKSNMIKDLNDILDRAIYFLLNDTQYLEQKENGYWDKNGNYYELDNKNNLFERFIYDFQFATNKLNVDLTNLILPNQENINKVNVFLNHLTNNNKIVKDALLNMLVSPLILDNELREKMTPCLMIYGPSNTGKSTLMKIYKKALNEEIVESKNIKLNNTELFNLINKKGIIFDDTKYFNNPNAVIDGNTGEMLGGFVNGDRREIKELYKQDKSDIKLQLMPIIVTNYKPTIETINMKRRTVFIKLNNNIDEDNFYKESLDSHEIYSQNFLNGFVYILFQHLKKILSDKNINKYSKNEIFNKFYHTYQLIKENNDINNGNWSQDIQLMFNQLNINSVNDLIFITQNELYNYYLQNNLGNKTLSEFSNEFEINGFKFDRVGITCKNGQRMTTTIILKYKNKQQQKERLKYMRKSIIVPYIDKNTGEVINNKYFGDNKETVNQYSLKNLN